MSSTETMLRQNGMRLMLDKKLCLCWRLMEASKEVLQKCTEGSNPPVHFDLLPLQRNDNPQLCWGE